MKFWQSAANYLRIIYHSLLLKIHRVDWPAGSFSRMSCSPITHDYTDLLNGDYEPRCPFHGAQYLPDPLH